MQIHSSLYTMYLKIKTGSKLIYYVNDDTVTLIQVNCGLVFWRPVAKCFDRHPEVLLFILVTLAIIFVFCVTHHWRFHYKAGWPLDRGDPDAVSVASPTLRPPLGFSCDHFFSAKAIILQTQERANCFSSSVWIKQAIQKLFALNHIVRPFNNAWKHHLFSSSLVSGRQCSRLICSALLLSSYIKI